MKNIKKVVKVIFITFLLATVVMLAFIIIISARGEVAFPALGNLFGEFYLIILCAAIIAIIIAVPTGVTIYIKKNGIKKFMKITACAFVAGTVFFRGSFLDKVSNHYFYGGYLFSYCLRLNTCCRKHFWGNQID